MAGPAFDPLFNHKRKREGQMRSMILAAALVAVSVSCAYADDVMASRYGNTTMATDSKGVQTKIYYQAGGMLTGKQGDLSFKGTWKVDAANKLCLNFSGTAPKGMANPFCVTVSDHKVGDTWKSDDRTVTLVKGIQ
jgi:hypothetical protein